MLPYLNLQNRIKLNHAVPHSLDFRNGFRTQIDVKHKTGVNPLDDDSVANVTRTDTALYDPVLTYGCMKQAKIPPFRPDFVLNDNIVLTFNGFFREKIIEANHESYDRIRYVNVMYFMEDDTMTIMEPPVINSGYPQGRIVRRARIVKDQATNEHYSWKDLNIGIDLIIFGITYHLLDCDKFTRHFLQSNGIELNEVKVNSDGLTTKNRLSSNPKMRSARRNTQIPRPNTRSDGIVLSFDCVRFEERKNLSDCITFKLYYFLEDNSVAVKELKENKEGRNNFPMLLKRSKVPKGSKRMLVDWISSSDEFDEPSEEENVIGPLDLVVGDEIIIYGHRFLLLNCDAHTRKYYSEVLKVPQKDQINIEMVKPVKLKMEIPEYLGIGTPEDSLASCYHLVPKPPRKNIVNYLLHANKFLRFGCTLDSVHPEDKNRQFILKYSLADGKISIVERSQCNSGIQGGKFLSSQLIVRPGGNQRVPEYYTSKDLYIGALLTINCHRFRIICADAAVYFYMQEHPDLFSPEAIKGVKDFLKINATAKEKTSDDDGNCDLKATNDANEISDVTAGVNNLCLAAKENNYLQKHQQNADEKKVTFFEHF